MPDRLRKEKAGTNDLKISNEVFDQILENYQKPEDLFGSDGTFAHLKERLVQRALDTELSHHLAYENGAPRPEGQDVRNGHNPPKTIKTHAGTLQVQLPRDRDGDFEPAIVPKHVRRLAGVRRRVDPSLRQWNERERHPGSSQKDLCDGGVGRSYQPSCQ